MHVATYVNQRLLLESFLGHNNSPATNTAKHIFDRMSSDCFLFSFISIALHCLKPYEARSI